MIELKKTTDCCGCGACMQVCPVQCINFMIDAEGFEYPLVAKEACIACGLCEKVCPVINPRTAIPPIKTLAAKNINEDIREASSSGGAFTILAEKIIDQGGVVFGAVFDSEWAAVHCFTETKEGLAAIRGSKYLQSRMGDNYKIAEKFLKEGRKVLFSGTSCQIAGLKNFLRKDYPNLYAVDIICHGVPSPKVWKAYLAETIQRLTAEHCSPITISDISFRNKITGWKYYSVVIKGTTLANSEELILLAEKVDKNSFMKGFLRDMYCRPSCHQCPSKNFTAGADISIADYWGIRRFYKEFDDDRGVSLVFINTDKGGELFDLSQTQYIETEYAQAIAGNKGIEVSSKPAINRRKFFSLLGKLPIEQAIKKSLKKDFAYRIKKTTYKAFGISSLTLKIKL